MKTPIKNAAKLTPAILKAKQSGAQGRFPGTLRTMEDDIRALGLDPAKFLGQDIGRGGATGLGNRNTGAGEARRGVKGETGVPDAERTEIDHKRENKAFEPAAEVIALDGDSDEGLNERMRGGRRTKGKVSAIAPTEEDVHPESADHVDAANAVQKESDKAVRNAAVDHAAVVRSKGMKRRAPSPGEGGVAGAEGHATPSEKNSDRVPKKRKDAYEIHGKVAHPANAARVDADPPLDRLLRVQRETWGNVAPSLNSPVKRGKGKIEEVVGRGEAVVYWMRMQDMRVVDNHALSLAANQAAHTGLPLVVLFVLTPGDYKAHDRSPRRIDFCLRNLRLLKKLLDAKNIPLIVDTYTDNRFHLPQHLLTDILPRLKATHVFGNIEYEVDELRRDTEVVKLGAAADGTGKVKAVFVHDRLAVAPGVLKSGKGTPYAVYSPWQRQWAAYLNNNPENLEEYPEPAPNPAAIRQHPVYGELFQDGRWNVPDEVGGFQCRDRELMDKLWPVGTDKALQVLDKFLHGQARHEHLGLVDPLQQHQDPDDSSSRIKDYASSRNSCDGNSSSRMSPYLASGIVSARMVLNKAKALTGGKLESGRDSGIGIDFYNHVLAFAPRVSMGRPFLEQFSDVQWETDENKLQAWKDGRTGFPIVDAAQRQANIMGWMHNRPRMICASFLVKDLMLDWRLGERFFMESFIDGDLAANNGGWQWCASTGTDPQPYFRIFNPKSQSETASPDGAYIRYWVPELRGVSDKAIHDPYGKLTKSEFEKLGYPKPIVDHAKSRARALFRYKNVGEREE
ncbi:hypothetical protein QFC20_007743 [Naganishia adeliensis]|uniref:Uncharacterized protein n=1 Tax=Naganishia adeliensis TaxID=92952 RepID=A0ACC2UW35_9TREE|nr:hypothetical protein QFC20_007743 [Naganishia adeliensis]